MQEESVPVIRFKPDEARTLKISELFDGYEVLTFKGIVCNRIGDFVKMGDRIVATSIVTEGMTDVVTLSVFDSAGEFQHTLGRFGRGPDEYLYLPHEIVLTPDSNVLAGDVLGFHCYALDGTLLWQKRSEHPSYEYGVGYFTWMLNDKKRLNSYEDLPLVLDVADIQWIMGISRASAYELVHTPGFPAFRRGRLIKVSRSIMPSKEIRNRSRERSSFLSGYR